MKHLSSVIVFSLAMALSGVALAAGPGHRLGQADYYLKEFEREVARERGGQKAVWRTKNDALTRVKALKVEFPDDPAVEALYQRARRALMASMGQLNEVDPAWTAYKRNEENLRQLVSAEGEKAWDALIKSVGTNFLEKVYPVADPEVVGVAAVTNRYVVLSDVRYPMNQFYGATGEFIACGKPSEGFYFVSLAGRAWLGPYEAVKRYRRTVDSSLEDVDRWTVLGEIVGLTAEIPYAGEEKVGEPEYGWIVRPVALKVPGHVVGVYDADAPSSGRFVAEDKVAAIKEGWYTVKSIPDDVTPERLMEIFMTAIKEKNFDLYEACIAPDRKKTPIAESLVRYHWDLHQARFHKEYIHATFEKGTIRVRKGFDAGNELNDFFLDDAQKDRLVKTQGAKIEEAVVESRAIDPNGVQLGTPHKHTLMRTGGGRWYVEDYEIRF